MTPREGREPRAGWPVVLWAGYMSAALELTTKVITIDFVKDWTPDTAARCIVQPIGANLVQKYQLLLGFHLTQERAMAGFLERFIEETASLMVTNGILPEDKRERFVKELRHEYITALGADCLQLTQDMAVKRIQAYAEEHYASVN